MIYFCIKDFKVDRGIYGSGIISFDFLYELHLFLPRNHTTFKCASFFLVLMGLRICFIILTLVYLEVEICAFREFSIKMKIAYHLKFMILVKKSDLGFNMYRSIQYDQFIKYIPNIVTDITINNIELDGIRGGAQ